MANFFKGLWEAVSGFFVDLWNGIKEVWETVSNWFNEHVVEPIKTVFAPLVEWFTNLFTSIWNFIASVFQVIGQLAAGCWEIIKAVWSVVSAWFNEHVVQPVSNFFKGLWDAVSGFFKSLWEDIKAVWSVVSTWFDEKVVQPVKKFFSGMWDGLKKGATDAWDGIKNVFGKVKDWFHEKFSAAWEAVKKVFETGGKIFEGIKEGIGEAFKKVVNAIIRGINKVVAFPFNAINGFLDTLRNLSILGIQPFKWIGSISVPQIPELAKGGVLKRGQMALLEGSGAEAVVPLENNRKWIAQVVKGFVDEMNLNGLKGTMNSQLAAMTGNNSTTETMTQNVTFNQTINSPKAVDRLTIYRETNSLLFSAKVRLADV